MKSFERPISQWKELESELRIPLGAIEVYRTRFGEIENRLAGAVRRLGHLELGSPFDTILSGENRHATPAPLAEALDVSMRHALGHSISGHRDVRRRITSEYDDMVLSSELLKDLHRSVLDTKAPGAGVFRTNPSHFPEFDSDGNWIASTLTVPPGDVTIYLEHLHERFHGLMESNVVHPMLPIAGYAFDLFRIHPFADGNGRLTRLAMLLLLHKAGYHIGRYISIEGNVNMRRMSYLEAITKSKVDWIAARHDLRPWCSFVVEMVLDAYQEFSDRTSALAETTGHLDAVTQAIERAPQRFTTKDLLAYLPATPVTLAKIVLNRMRLEGRLKTTLSETAVEWRKVNPASSSPPPNRAPP